MHGRIAFGHRLNFFLLLVLSAAIPLAAAGAGCGRVPAKMAGIPVRDGDALVNKRQLTRDFADVAEGRFSPDMRWIAFRAVPNDEEAPQLYIAPLVRNGGGEITGIGPPIRITPAGSRNSSPAFSPDGRSLIFASTARSENDPLLLHEDPPQQPARPPGFDFMAEIFRVDNWQRNIAAADPRRGVDLTQYTLTRNRGFDGEAVFSPDGSHIAYASDQAAPRAAVDTFSLVDVYVMAADGSGNLRVTRSSGYDGYPAFSPDGRTLVFHSERAERGVFDLWAVDLVHAEDGRIVDSENLRRITRAGGRQPVFHPSGDFILYVTRRHDLRGVGTDELRQIRPDGSRDIRLTFDPASDEAPAFSPDGRYLLWSSRRTADGSRQLFIAEYRRPRRS